MTLHSFIVSNTALQDVNWARGLVAEDFAREQVFFQDQTDYVDRIVRAIAAGGTGAREGETPASSG